MKLDYIRRIGFALLFILIITGVLSSCEYGATIKVRNQTNEVLQIFGNGVYVDNVDPREELKFKTNIVFPHHDVTAKDLDGNVVYSKRFTSEELRRNGWRVVISATGTQQSDNVTGK